MSITASDVLSLLADIMDFLDNQADAEIDAEGRIMGNKAMRLLGECEEAYAAIEKAGGIANDIMHQNEMGRTYP